MKGPLPWLLYLLIGMQMNVQLNKDKSFKCNSDGLSGLSITLLHIQEVIKHFYGYNANFALKVHEYE